jgi:L-ascorbate metabolism protein UlaG (beta-lactamase superfamily)
MRRFLGACALLLAFGAAGAGEIKISWFGQSMFLVVTPAGKRVILDPHNLEAYRVMPQKADLVLMSHFHTDHTNLEVVTGLKEAKQFNDALPRSPDFVD